MNEKEMYFSLREEINYNQKQENEMTRFSYTAIIAILGTSLTIENNLVTMLSLIIIIPISFRVARYRDSIAYISTYMAVFLEPKIDFKWEKHHAIYSEKYRSSYFSKFLYFVSRADFLFLSVITIAIFWIQNQEHNLIHDSNILKIIIVLLQFMTIVIEIILFKNFSSIPDLKKLKIQNWEMIHSQEEKN